MQVAVMTTCPSHRRVVAPTAYLATHLLSLYASINDTLLFRGACASHDRLRVPLTPKRALMRALESASHPDIIPLSGLQCDMNGSRDRVLMHACTVMQSDVFLTPALWLVYAQLFTSGIYSAGTVESTLRDETDRAGILWSPRPGSGNGTIPNRCVSLQPQSDANEVDANILRHASFPSGTSKPELRTAGTQHETSNQSSSSQAPVSLFEVPPSDVNRYGPTAHTRTQPYSIPSSSHSHSGFPQPLDTNTQFVPGITSASTRLGAPLAQPVGGSKFVAQASSSAGCYYNLASLDTVQSTPFTSVTSPVVSAPGLGASAVLDAVSSAALLNQLNSTQAGTVIGPYRSNGVPNTIAPAPIYACKLRDPTRSVQYASSNKLWSLTIVL
ncbi:unnamed protein product [Echinostoma caproni]|uniref:Uncharacterized protein n=1 Tax=Echinostoma caproni TaxID=27848 RepID=A0A183AZC2_9TREM|nr:unnamed protein product [Echinostoma caproni]